MAPQYTALAQRYQGLKVFSDEASTRFCFPVATDQLIFKNSPDAAPRSPAEVIEVAEATFGGKFSMNLETDPQKPLAPASGRLSPHAHGPLATLEVWSLEPGTYDLVLKLPHQATSDETIAAHLISHFIDQAREVARLVDNIDLLRFESGPALTLPQAQHTLQKLETQTGTRLDTESLMAILKASPRALLN